MFDQHFSFDTPQLPSWTSTANTPSTRDTSRSVSPCSSAGPFPPPRFSVTDLAVTFANSRLRTDSQICYDSCESYANMDDDAGWEIPMEDAEFPSVSRVKSTPARPLSPSRRVQRQTNSRLLCSRSHAKDIAALVSRMVDRQDQCTIVASEPGSPSTEEDEGYNSGDAQSLRSSSRRSSLAFTKPRLEYRRSSDLNSTRACVSKTVRQRKTRQHKRIWSSESES